MTDRLATGELPGSTLDDRYTVQEMVGRGGMAVVYRAWDTELHRAVAIKLLRGDAGEGLEALRRIREAQALASINHPSLVTLYDAVIRDDRSYLVMELVDGVTLRAQISAGRLPSRDVAAIAHDLADALHSVHARGIIHRDIKPGNVLLAPTTIPDQRFRAKLADFGVAHFVDATRVTTPGLFLGTANYVSPEQARGYEPAAPADIYALGLTLLEALTGEAAFVGSPLEVVSARLARDPHIPAWLGLEWSALLTRMTDRDPTLRPTAIEVAAAARALPLEDVRPMDDSVATGAIDLVAPHLAPVGSSAVPQDPAPEDRATTSAATKLLPKVAPDDTLDGIASAEGDDPQRHGMRRRTIVVAAAAALVVLLIAAGLLLLPTLTAPADPAPTPAPTLPALPPPLDADMRDLLDQVTP